MRRNLLVPAIRPRVPLDDAFVLALGAQAFARWSLHPAQTIRAMLGARRASALIAELDGEAVGFAIVDVEPLGRAYGPWPSPKVARLDAIAVSTQACGRRIGAHLLVASEDLARKEGAVVMTLMTATQNKAGRRLFASARFSEVLLASRSYANGDSAIEMFKSLA